MPTDERTITIDFLPEDMSPTGLARAGEFMGLESNGPDDNPSPRAWARAGVAVGAIMRAHEGRISADLLVATIACNADPAKDDSTPERAKLIGEHESVEHEWFHGPDAPKPESTPPSNDEVREAMLINLREWMLAFEGKAARDSDPVSGEIFTDDDGRPVGGLLLIRTPEAFEAINQFAIAAGLITPGKGIVDGT